MVASYTSILSAYLNTLQFQSYLKISILWKLSVEIYRAVPADRPGEHLEQTAPPKSARLTACLSTLSQEATSHGIII